jgi:hypothetical protein
MERAMDRRTRVILLADGMSAAGHLEDRHLTQVGSKPLLLRSVQQFGEWARVGVATRNDAIWKAVSRQKNIYRILPEDLSDQYYGLDLVRKGLDAARGERSVVAFGDVYFSDQAIETIKNHEVDEWAMYGRSTDNKLTGCTWGEPFAFEVNPGSKGRAREALNMVVSYYLAGEWPRCSVWEWYYHMEKMPYNIPNPANCPTGPHWVEINDITDDVDFQRDLIGLRRAVERYEEL